MNSIRILWVHSIWHMVFADVRHLLLVGYHLPRCVMIVFRGIIKLHLFSHLACEEDRLTEAKLLLEAGADCNIINRVIGDVSCFSSVLTSLLSQKRVIYYYFAVA